MYILQVPETTAVAGGDRSELPAQPPFAHDHPVPIWRPVFPVDA